MIVAHLGPPLGRMGGPGGYLAQLDAALAAHGTGGHTVLLPPRAAAAGRARPSWRARWLGQLRRVKRRFSGPPAYYRPATSELVRIGGELDRTIAQAWADVRQEIAPSLHQALDARADVIVAHDAPSAGAALDRRAPGQQVWLMMHNPMPLALYLAWCWGVPDRAWEEVASYPDVQRWMTRERAVIDQVDRLFIPCREAVDELVRIAARYASSLDRTEFLLTGAAGPPRSRSRAQARAAFGLPGSEPVGLFLGNAQPYRGLDALLAAVERLDPRHALPGVIAIAGPPVSDVPLGRRLTALGPVAEVGDLLGAVDFVINVNRFSLFDLSTIEALEAGAPLLLHATGGNRTFAGLGAGAVMIESLDPDVVAAGLTTMFRLPADERARLGTASRACYERHLTPRHLRDRHVAIYDGARVVEATR
ncbi:MAG: glycosyltransferase [Vicinamibacteria bacterium]